MGTNKRKLDLSNSFFWQSNSTTLATLGVLIVLMVILTIMQPTFLSVKNLINIVLQASVVSMLAIGMTFIIISGGINLAVGSTMALCVVVAGDMVVNKGANFIVAFGLCILIGIISGFFEGVLISKLNIPPFIVTLGTMSLWRGIALEYVHGEAIYGLPDGLTWLGSYKIGTGNFQIPVAVLCVILLFFIAWFVLSKTRFGMHVYAVGGNEHATNLSGVSVSKTKIAIYTLAGFMCSIAAIITLGRMNGAIATVGEGYELDAIASVAIGGASMSGGKGKMWGTFIGAMILQVIRNGMNFLQVSPYYQKMVIGLVIIVAVGIDCVRRSKKE